MQVDPIKPTLKVPGIKRLKIIRDDPLSNFASKFNLRRYTSVHMNAGVVAGVQGSITGNIDITLPALTKSGGDMSIAGSVTFDTAKHEYIFTVDELLFTHPIMILNASGILAIQEELSFLEFEGHAMIMVPGIVAFEASLFGMLMLKQPNDESMYPTFVIEFNLKSMQITGGIYVEDASFNVEVFVDASGGVTMRAGLNGTIGLSRSLPAALGDFGVSAHLETKIIMDDSGLSLDGDIKVRRSGLKCVETSVERAWFQCFNILKPGLKPVLKPVSIK